MSRISVSILTYVIHLLAILLTIYSKLMFVFHVKPSPLGLPDSANTGKNHKHLFSPNTCIQFSNLFNLNYNKMNQRIIKEILTLLSSRLAGSRDSIVVEFMRTRDM